MGEQLLEAALKALADKLEETGQDVNVQDLLNMVTKHACAAAVAAMASGWVPGAAGAIVSGVGTAFVISLYVRLGKALGVKLSKGLIRAVASVVAAEVASYLAVSIVGVTALSLFPGLGSLGASAISAISNFAFVYISALIYVKMLDMLMGGNGSIDHVDDEAVKAAAAAAAASTDMKKAMAEARRGFKEAKQSGEMDRANVDAEPMDDV
ncbi:MAG: hypothetical protein IJE07_14470 [Clostridia bacterium]|nr:hypothetical protein [Clostridia bacterium]